MKAFAWLAVAFGAPRSVALGTLLLLCAATSCASEDATEFTCSADDSNKTCTCVPNGAPPSGSARVVAACSNYPCCYANAERLCQCYAELGGAPLTDCRLIQVIEATQVPSCPAGE
jgi:hypothetical protein